MHINKTLNIVLRTHRTNDSGVCIYTHSFLANSFFLLLAGDMTQVKTLRNIMGETQNGLIFINFTYKLEKILLLFSLVEKYVCSIANIVLKTTSQT